MTELSERDFVSNSGYDEFEPIPQIIIDNEDSVALAKFVKDSYGKTIDRRKKWSGQLKDARYFRKKYIEKRARHNAMVEEDMSTWPWKEGYEFRFEGTAEGSCYLKVLRTGLDIYLTQDEVPQYLNVKQEIKPVPIEEQVEAQNKLLKTYEESN